MSGVRSSAHSPLRSKQERDRLVEQYIPLVRHVVARLPVTMPASLDRDDFFSVGVVGLMHAATAYDPTRGASFKTFAYTAIRGAILDEIRKHDPVPRNRRDRLRQMDRAAADLYQDLGRPPTLDELAERLDVRVDDLDDDLLALNTARLLSLDEGQGSSDDGEPSTLATSVIADDVVDPSDSIVRKDLTDQLARAISELPEVDRHVVVLYHYEGLYLKEIGQILGVSESRVSQILSRAMARLQLKMKGGSPSED